MLKQLVRRNFGILRGDLNRIRITHHHDAATRVRWFSLSPNMISEAPVQQSLEGGAPVLTKEEKDVGIIALNRPKQLNALLPEMGDIMASKLQAWEKSDAVKMIMVKGIGEKAFCAGGDIKRIIKKIGEGDYEEAERGFGVQYRVFHLVGSLQRPYIAFLNGITMGGGVGLSAHGPFRVATEATVFAMPETCIGLFNDAGTSFLLPRLDGQLGIYLGLTGKRIKGVDVFYSGVATHYVHSSRLAELENRLLSLQTKDHNSVNTLLEECSVDMDQDQLTFSLGGGIRAAIDRCFKYNTIEEIIEALRTETDEPQWAKETLDMLSKASPTSLKVTLELMRKGAKMSLGQCIKTEFELASKFIRGHEFVEGVNALLIERRTPRWNPDTVENVKNVKQEYFEQSSPFKLSLLSDTDFDQYPFSFGLPSDEEIVSALSSMKDYADLDALVRDRFKGKKGVKSKIKDVASRINAAGL